jgi:hypothetical protein
VILCFYVDNILMFGSPSKSLMRSNLSYLNIEMKDIGEVDVILNNKVLRNKNNGITLVHSDYVQKVLRRFGYFDYKPYATPYDLSVLLRMNQNATRNKLRYSQIIGPPMYLASATRVIVRKPSHFLSIGECSSWGNALSKRHHELWNPLRRVSKST